MSAFCFKDKKKVCAEVGGTLPERFGELVLTNGKDRAKGVSWR